MYYKYYNVLKNLKPTSRFFKDFINETFLCSLELFQTNSWSKTGLHHLQTNHALKINFFRLNNKNQILSRGNFAGNIDDVLLLISVY